MKRVKQEVKVQLRDCIEDQLDAKVPREAKIEMMLIWIVGLMENVDRHNFLEERD